MVVRNVTFYFEGRPLRGVEGEPIAKALFSAGIRTLSYSVKYKRPRGIHCGRGRCIACHMSVDGVPGVPTCITPLRAGMSVEREDYAPLYGPFAARAARLVPLPAGFYYRMFTRPAFVRNAFMGALRRLAGVGRIPPSGGAETSASPPASPAGASPAPAVRRQGPDAAFPAGPRYSGPIQRSYDVAVVGSGLSGMSAALSSAHRGMNVLLVDEYDFPGGHSFGYQPDTELVAARDELVERLRRHVSIDYRAGVTAQGFYPPDTLLLGRGGAAGSGRDAGPADGTGDSDPGELGDVMMARVRARAFVFATGANDLVPLFENSDLPGVFGERAIRLFLERDDFRPGRRAVVYGVGRPLRTTAQLLLHHDIRLVALIDPTAGAKTDQHGRRVLDKVRTLTETRITAARGRTWVDSVEAAPGAGGRKVTLQCDMVCVALPGQPAYELPYQAGFEFALADSPLEENRVMLPAAITRKSPESGAQYFIVGEAAGEREWKTWIEKGKQAGVEAAESVRA